MRFFNALKNDIRFQIKYGFYFLYAFFSLVYMAVLWIMPSEYKNMTASLIILTDPAMLGIFFIGGIWLLEKGEGLHRFWSISPLRPLEYLLSKSISLAVLSTVSAELIALAGLKGRFYPVSLSLCVFWGAVVFNLIGLLVASYARSVNHYMIIVVLPTVFLSIPPILTAFGIRHPILELFPGTALWHMIAVSLHQTENTKVWWWVNLILWLGLMLVLANRRMSTALQAEGGEGI